MSKVYIGLSEDILKQASLISLKYSDKDINSVIEECFYYGVRSLYADVPKPFLKEIIQKEESNTPIPDTLRDNITSVIENARNQADEYSSITEDIPSSYGDAVLTEDGLFEL